MLIADTKLEEGINWRLYDHSEGISRAVASLVILRGEGCAHADTSALHSPAMYVGAQGHDVVFSQRSARCFADLAGLDG